MGFGCSDVGHGYGDEIPREVNAYDLLIAELGGENCHPSHAGAIVDECGQGIDWH